MRTTLVFILFINCLSAFGQHDTLEVLSWNVFLRPAILNDGQLDRVDSISDYLLHSDADILVLQEVFHKKASRQLRKNLRATYPNQTKRGPKSWFGVPSGVVIFSRKKLPIKSSRHISFKKAKGSDRLARKGFVRALIKYRKHRIDLIGTHLQAGGGSKRNNIRMNQLQTISEEVNQPDSGALKIFAGDFNIDEKSTYMDSLKNTLNVDYQRSHSTYRYTANFNDHELFESTGSPKWIDFILTERSNNIEQARCKIECPTQLLNGEKKRLSDHNPIKGWIVLSDH